MIPFTKTSILLAGLFTLTLNLRALDIHEAARAGDLPKVRAIVEKEHGLVGAQDAAGRTPLHWACRGVHTEVIKYLIEHGADVNARDRALVTPLHSISSRGHLEAARMLIAAGAKLEAQMSDQSTPLHLAAAGGFGDLAAFLLDKGAPLGVQDQKEDTPLHAAAWEGKWETLDLLVARLAPGQAAAPDLKDFDGNTVLHLAGRAGRLKTVELLVSKGADLDARNTLGQTAFNLAEEGGFGDVAAFLVQKGADRSAQKFPALSGPYLGLTPPGAVPKLFAKGIVSRRNGMYGTITFSPDGREAFWKSDPPYEESWMKMEDGYWGPPRKIPFKALEHIDVPFFSLDGRRLYFMSGSRNAQGIVEKESIWFVEKADDGWSEPELFDPVVNSVTMHWQFSLDKRGNVYLNSDGGIRCARFEDGRYLAPELLPAPIRVDHKPEEKYRAGQLGPFISPEGDYLIFTKFEVGQLFISFRERDGSWTEPRNLSEKLRTEGLDSMARVTPDGKYLFFQSRRAGSGASRGLYWVEAAVVEEMRPKK